MLGYFLAEEDWLLDTASRRPSCDFLDIAAGSPGLSKQDSEIRHIGPAIAEFY